MKHLVFAAAVCLSVTVMPATLPLDAQGSDTATVFTAVTDRGGKPLKGLTAEDFSVAEDGAARQVITVEPATGPLSVALLIDRFGQDSTFSILAVRGALESMVKTLHAANLDTEISVTTIDPAAVPQIPFTMSTVQMLDFINRLPPGVNQAVLLEGIMTASKSMSAAKYSRRVIVALVAGYKPEGSAVEVPLVAATLRQSGASLWVLEGRSSFGGGSVSSTRDAALTFLVPASGGARVSVGLGTALETQGKRLVETLLSQYAVTFAAPSPSATTRAITVSVKDAKVLAPAWITR